jgi:hypothetical protein
MITTKISFTPNAKMENEKAGLVVMGSSYAGLALKSKKDGIYLVQIHCKDAAKGKPENETLLMRFSAPAIHLRVNVRNGGLCTFSYSVDGITFTTAGEDFASEPGRWKGAKVGLFCSRETQTNDSGYADVDWFRLEPLISPSSK